MFPIVLAFASLVASHSQARPEEPTVRLGVRAMAAPKPAMKYQLLPELRELKPGNSVQWYLRSFMEQRNFFFNKEVVAERSRQQTMPLKDLPADKLKNYGGSALTQADWGARLDTPDWQVLDRVQTEGAELVFPEIGSLRMLAAALQVRFRGEVARRDFDDAIRTCKTMLALARHLGEHPTSTANLLGVSIASMAFDTLEEMVQQPGCPNLYWALTDLPIPLVELRKGFQGDRARAIVELRPFRDDAILSVAELDELVGGISGRAGFRREQAGLPPRSLRKQVEVLTKDAERVAADRARLIAAGSSRELVAKFLPLQVILLNEKLDFESRHDDATKLLGLTCRQLDDQIALADRGDGIFNDLLPRVAGIARRAQGRLEQRIAVLRHVESLRLYAAKHAGRLPGALDQVGVPLPVDPFTGKEFAYKLEGATARLRGGTPRGEEKNPAFRMRYEITIEK